MIYITYTQMLLCITACWLLYRGLSARARGGTSMKQELKMIMVYICIIVISRFVYFPFRLVEGEIQPLTLGLSTPEVSLIPFYFLRDRYAGWQMNIGANIAMFIPVGIVWPICYPKLNTFGKTVLAGAGYTLLIELTQLLCTERHTDVDDLLLNTCGVVIGAGIVFGIRRLKKEKKHNGK